MRTGSGGYHIYLRCSEPLPNTANRLGPWIDTRGEGGYVVAPPSHNASGPYTKWRDAGIANGLPESTTKRAIASLVVLEQVQKNREHYTTLVEEISTEPPRQKQGS